MGRNQQSPAGEADHVVEGEQVVARKRGLAVQRPERLRVRPGRVVCTAATPSPTGSRPWRWDLTAGLAGWFSRTHAPAAW
jgi:hypothetical protein